MNATVVYHPDYQTYDFGPAHPFSPVRLAMLQDLLAMLEALPEYEEPTPATRNDVLQVHSKAFVAQVEAASRSGIAAPGALRYGLGTEDVPAFTGMDAATRLLVGGTLHAARLVASGRTHRALQLGGGLHHARHALASGFCVYNDPAIAIRHLLAQGLRVAYLDVDVHHGDGVQALLYDEPEAMTISFHESGQYLYPGSGFPDELGEGAGKGCKLNVPLEPFTYDASYLEVFERVVPHTLAWFRPDVLVVECGADAHAADPLAHLMLTSHAFETLFRRILALADAFTGGRAVFHLGGGYDLDATVRVWTLLTLLVRQHELPERLPEPWLDRWQRRLGRSLTPTLHDQNPGRPPPRYDSIAQKNRAVSQHLLEIAAPYWR